MSNKALNKRRRRSKKKNYLPLLLILLVLIIIIGVALALVSGKINEGDLTSSNSNSISSESSQTISDNSSSKEEIKATDKPTATPIPTPTASPTPIPEPFEMTWNLLLVNENNPLPDDFSPSLVTYGEKKVDERIYDSLKDMINDAGAAGGTLWVASGYRSVATQESILERAVNNRMEQYDMTKEEATENALLTIAVPGCSEHHTGLAVDFNYVNQEFEDTFAFEWLRENAAEYGFILRYRKDKEDITMINYEPWHYRYVGVEAAKEMKELDMCLEEYIEYLGG